MPVTSSVAPFDPSQTSLDTIGEIAGGNALGLSSRKTQLAGLAMALVAAGCGALFVRHRLRQRRRETTLQRLQNQVYMRASRVITATILTVGPMHDRQAPVLSRLSPLLVEAILRRKTGATPLLAARAAQALPPRKRR